MSHGVGRKKRRASDSPPPKRKKNWDESSSSSEEDDGSDYEDASQRKRAASHTPVVTRTTSARRAKEQPKKPTRFVKPVSNTVPTTKGITKPKTKGQIKTTPPAKSAAAFLAAVTNATPTITTTTPVAAPPKAAAPPKPLKWTLKRHTLKEGQKVKLSPHVRMKGDRIARLAVGRMRTPSPFGAKMGDHTSAWTVAVDDVHALVHGKTLAEAAGDLMARQLESEAWIGQPRSIGRQVWDLYGENDLKQRQPVLETYAYEVRDALKNPLTAEGLAKAVAHHLAFRNFLPFATVPAKGKIGSKGSGESAARAAALAPDLERERRRQIDEETEAQRLRRKKREQAEQVLADQIEAWTQEEETKEETLLRHEAQEQARLEREQNVMPRAEAGLWKLFSLDAALREARADRVVAPARHRELVETVQRVRKLGGTARTLGEAFLANEKKAASSSAKLRKEAAKERVGIGILAAELRKQADDLAARPDTGHPEIKLLMTDAAYLGEVVQSVQSRIMDATKGRAEATKLNTRIGERNDAADDLLDDLEGDPADVEKEAALILGYLLHDHQAMASRAYPLAAAETGFLGADAAKAAKAAIEHLAGRLQLIPDHDDAAIGRLLGMVEKVHQDLGPVTPSKDPGRWVAGARTDSLVVSFKDGGKAVSIQGRAAAPSGVEGMGSHTTAWVTEVQAVEKLVAKHKKDGIQAVLKEETLKELESDLMTQLATALPADQLDGGQLGDIFDAALEVLTAEDPADTVRAYLEFRNLLPYATVDSGDRGGHGERRDGTKNDLFDLGSLAATVDLKAAELAPDRLGATAGALTSAAEVLRTTLAAAIAQPGGADDVPGWNADKRLERAVTRTISALEKDAAQMKKAVKNKSAYPVADVANRIIKVRRTEHGRVFDLSQTKP
ncbi:hypothetical protein [Actinocorallia longicatena]|uniref:Uncharacterized protein n=1 Tax=Actinocorallia longicatena TaxID=111803 RepID=A0ABP6QI83_9ACTN